MRSSRVRRTTAPLLWLLVSLLARGEDIVFPPDAGVVDVTRAPYFARGDGRTDDTEALQQALLDNGNSNRVVYLPNGVYLLSGTLLWPGGANRETRQRHTILQGQSRDGVVLRLADHAPGFGNSGRPRPILWAGNAPGVSPRNALRNLTIHSGSGNPGATGVRFFANRQGGMRDVAIVAGADGAGTAGLDVGHSDQIGPAYFRNLRIEGFDLGIKAGGAVFSLTFEDVALSGQKVAGIRNSGQVLNIRRLVSSNAVGAVQNYDATGHLTLLDSTLQGLTGSRRQEIGLVNRAMLFARSVTLPGYTNAFENRAGGQSPPEDGAIAEFVSHEPFGLFPSITNSLALPVEDAPEPAWDPLPAWSGPQRFGARPDGGADCSEALQRAIDSGAPTIYFPNGLWTINRQVVLRGKARRVIGCEARLAINLPPGTAAFRIEDGASPVVHFERLEVAAGTVAPLVDRAASRTLVLRDCAGLRCLLNAGGDLFLENVSSTGPWVFSGHRVFARQLHVAYEGTKILNTNATVWILGLTTELSGTMVRTVGGGKTEVLGALCVSSGGWKADPMFAVEDAQATFHVSEASFGRAPYQTIVAETRKGRTLKLASRTRTADRQLPERLGGVMVPFFTAQPQR